MRKNIIGLIVGLVLFFGSMWGAPYLFTIISISGYFVPTFCRWGDCVSSLLG